MKENFKDALDKVLVHEGGFSDHPSDPGGATMKGVTLRTFRRHFGADKTVSDLKRITKKQLQTVYKSGYWDKCKCDALPSGVDYATFDSAVNSGPGRAARWLQSAVGAERDGAIGPNTLDKVAVHEPVSVINDMLDARMSFLRGLSTFSVFGRGWTRRVSEVRRDALTLANSGSLTSSEPDAPGVDFVAVHLGSRGDWVARLQSALGIVPDGDFGPVTDATLRAFQEEHGLEVDGIAGRATYRALGLIA